MHVFAVPRLHVQTTTAFCMTKMHVYASTNIPAATTVAARQVVQHNAVNTCSSARVGHVPGVVECQGTDGDQLQERRPPQEGASVCTGGMVRHTYSFCHNSQSIAELDLQQTDQSGLPSVAAIAARGSGRDAYHQACLHDTQKSCTIVTTFELAVCH